MNILGEESKEAHSRWLLYSHLLKIRVLFAHAMSLMLKLGKQACWWTESTEKSATWLKVSGGSQSEIPGSLKSLSPHSPECASCRRWLVCRGRGSLIPLWSKMSECKTTNDVRGYSMPGPVCTFIEALHYSKADV